MSDHGPTSKNEKSPTAKPLHVLIVGGSLSGLTLALALSHSKNIIYTLLESHPDIAPQVGASIALLPNGLRILDQLGVADDVMEKVEPLRRYLVWDEKGRKRADVDVGGLVGARTGYPYGLIERRDLLSLLYKHVPDKSHIRTSKKVTEISQNPSSVTVKCQDGSSYTGDILVGADGIHSIVHKKMQDHIDSKTPGATAKDRKGLSAEFSCIFGISKGVEVDPKGGFHRTYTKGYSTIVSTGKSGAVYWFLFSRLDRKYFGKEIPRFSEKDAEEAVKPFLNMCATDKIKYGEIWENRTVANMCCVEESQNEHWTSDRMVCLGDAVHKTTPNLGAGGNAAIESAAALANSLAKLSKTGQSLNEIKTALKGFYNKRHHRANLVCDRSNALTRKEAIVGFADRFVVFHILPKLRNFMADRNCAMIVNSEFLETLPPPAKSLTGTMPYNPEQGIGKGEKKWVRALYALPLLAFVYAAHKTMGAATAAILSSDFRGSSIDLGKGLVVPLQLKYTGWKGLDIILARYAGIFTSSFGGFDPAGQMQTIAFLAGDFVPLQVIFSIEAARRGNFLTVAHVLPNVFLLLAQIKGCAFFGPIYFFLHYVQSPLENYAAADNRMTEIGQAKTIIPTVLLSYVVPTIAMYTVPGLTNRQWINGLFWQAFPIYAAVLQRILRRFVKKPNADILMSNPEADMPYLRSAYAFAAATAACAYWYVYFASPVPLMEVFFHDLGHPSAPVSIMTGIAKALRYDHICVISSGFVWTLFSFYDLKKARKLNVGWGKVLAVLAGTTLVFGPGAAMATMWAWREETLANRQVPQILKE